MGKIGTLVSWRLLILKNYKQFGMAEKENVSKQKGTDILKVIPSIDN